MKFTIREVARKVPSLVRIYRLLLKLSRRFVFEGQYWAFKHQDGGRFGKIRWRDKKAYLTEATATTAFDNHYVFHTSWAARVLASTKPEKHVDISSDLRFATLVSAFIPMEFYDYRPASFGLSNLSEGAADLLDLPFSDNSVRSLSCMHVIEHIGLGRYGDPVDPKGDLKAIEELKRVLAPGGDLLFVVPVGKPRVIFNAHRIYSVDMVRSYFLGLALQEFALIPDNSKDGNLVVDPCPELLNSQRYGCGCFWFRKVR